jgi:hypothetical protein
MRLYKFENINKHEIMVMANDLEEAIKLSSEFIKDYPISYKEKELKLYTVAKIEPDIVVCNIPPF